MTALLLLACLPPVPEVVVEGRTTQVGALELTWPEGWTLAVDPALLRSGLPGVVLEARRGEMQAALTWHPLPRLGWVEQSSALDRLSWVSPAPGAAAWAGYRFGRPAACGDAAWRVLEGEGRTLTQLARSAPGGLGVLHAWGGVDAEALRALGCAGARVSP